MQEPTLVILAAGMGSRFGGLKQITAVDDHNHAIIDYSLFDAYRAGFRKVAFIIKHEIEEDFKARIGRRMEKYFDVKYVFQQLDRLPDGFAVPEGRVKPWGTGHAVLCARGVVDGPFAVINADDYYGPSAYTALYGFLSKRRAGISCRCRADLSRPSSSRSSWSSGRGNRAPSRRSAPRP